MAPMSPLRSRWLHLGGAIAVSLALAAPSSALGAGEWSAPAAIDPGLSASSVSCPSTSFCVAVGRAGAFAAAAVYNGGAWSEAGPIDTEAQLNSVSCPSSSFCMAMTGDGEALTYNGHTWSAPTAVGSAGLWSVSCVSSSFCLAAGGDGGDGEAAVYDDGSWGAPAQLNTPEDLSGVSCGSESFCVAVGGNDASVYNGSTWATATQVQDEGRLRGVSCPTSSFCAVVAEHTVDQGASHYAYSLTYSGGVWSAPGEIPLGPERGQSNVDAVSCGSPSFCAAVSPEGEAALYEDGAWGAFRSLAPNAALSSLSCPSPSFCVAVDEAGQAFTYTVPPTQAPVAGTGVTATGDGSPPPGARSGVAGVLGSRAVYVSSPQIAAQLTPSGKAAKIAALLARGWFGLPFRALEAGTAVIDWYEVPMKAKVAKQPESKAVLLAAGRHVFSVPSTAKIKLVLTVSGRRLLRRSGKLKVIAKGTFTPLGETPVTASRTFVLKR
jgi:hypothetical protein